MVIGSSILVQIDGTASVIVGELSGIMDGVSEGNLAFLAGFGLFLFLGLDGEGEDAVWVCAIGESASGKRQSQGRVGIGKGGRNNGSSRDNSLVWLTILVQVNRIPQQISCKLVCGNNGDLTLLAIFLGLSGNDVRSGIVVRVCGIRVNNRSDAISQRSDDFLGDFLLFEEGGSGRGLLSSVGLEDGGLDGVFNSGGCAIDDGVSIVGEGMGSIGDGNLTGGAGLGLICGSEERHYTTKLRKFGLVIFYFTDCLEVSLLCFNNLSSVFNRERSNASVNWGLQVGSRSNGEIVGGNSEAIATSGVRDLNQFALFKKIRILVFTLLLLILITY